MSDYKLIFKSFRSLEATWKAMETPDMSPFLHYDYMRFIKTSVAWFKPFFTRIACVCPEGSGEILMICPMKRRFDLKYYTLLGDMQGCDIADVIWKQGLAEEEKARIIRFFFDTMSGRMYLNRIPAESPFAAGVPQERVSYSRDVEYVAIDMYDSYEEYLQTLSKNMRHQINKTYNRLEREGVPQRLHKADGIACEKFFIILESEKYLFAETVPVKKAVEGRHRDRRNQNAAEENQCREQKNQNMLFVAVQFIHRAVPFRPEGGFSQIPGRSEKSRLWINLKG